MNPNQKRGKEVAEREGEPITGELTFRTHETPPH